MDHQYNELLNIHEEFIRREAYINQALHQSGLGVPTLGERALSSLGDKLIRFGTNLKKRSQHRLTADEATAPSYLIML